VQVGHIGVRQNDPGGGERGPKATLRRGVARQLEPTTRFLLRTDDAELEALSVFTELIAEARDVVDGMSQGVVNQFGGLVAPPPGLLSEAACPFRQSGDLIESIDLRRFVPRTLLESGPGPSQCGLGLLAVELQQEPLEVPGALTRILVTVLGFVGHGPPADLAEGFGGVRRGGVQRDRL